MKPIFSVTRMVSALFALAISFTALAEIPQLKLVNAYPNLKVKRPLWMQQLPDGRTFLLEQRGKVYLLPKNANGKSTTLFFDIEKRKPYVKDEEGLLGMAFHPKFAKNGKFYAFYSAHKPLRSVVSEFRVSKGGTIDLATERKLLTIQRPFWNHDGGCILFGPDGKLYVPVGAPCNVCDAPKPFATILRMNPDGSDIEVYAQGVRNSVGFDWHPTTAELWFTDNGRDGMGNDVPPDELNHAPQAGMHFGFPYCHGGDIPDPGFGRAADCSDFTAPAVRLGPHVASLGMRFYTGEMFPPEYRNQIFIAEHGSWNRSEKIGYRITLVRLENGAPVSYEPFAEGWLEGEQAWGRPVDLMVMPDGALLVSDDYADAIYRISYDP